MSALTMTACSSGTTSSAQSSSTAAPASSPLQESPLSAELAGIARRAATNVGEPSPTELQAVSTTRAKANNLTGAEVFSDVPVYLIQFRGTFSTAGQSRPAGANVPATVSGAMKLVVDARTGQQLDVNVSSASVDLATLGAVLNLT